MLAMRAGVESGGETGTWGFAKDRENRCEWGGSELGLGRGTPGSGTGDRGTLGGGIGVSETSIGIRGRVESTINRGEQGMKVVAVLGLGLMVGAELGQGEAGSGGIARPRISAPCRKALRMWGPKARGCKLVGCEVGGALRRCSMSSAVCFR